MNLQEFLLHVKKNQCRIIKGKEQLLYMTVRKQGYEGKDVQQAIINSSAQAFRQKMKTLIKVIPVQKKQIDLREIAKDYYLKFVEEKYVRAIDFIEIIHFIRQKKKPSVQEMGKKYGMREQYQKDFNELIQSISKIGEQLLKDHKQKDKWKQFDQSILQGNENDIRNFLQAFLQGQVIETAEKLRLLANKYKIFIKKNKQTQLFGVINNLGIQNKLSEQTIILSTYQAFLNELRKLCSKILKRRSQFNSTQIAGNIVHELRKQLMVPGDEIIKILNYCYFQRQEAQFKQIIQRFGIQGQIQQMKPNLLKLTSHLDQQFRKYQAQKIIQFCKGQLMKIEQSRIQQKQQEKQQIRIKIQFEADICQLKNYLKDQYQVPQDNSNKIIKYYYSNMTQQFDQICQNYGLFDQEGVVDTIKQKLDTITKYFDKDQEQQLKNQIYAFLEKKQQKVKTIQQKKDEVQIQQPISIEKQNKAKFLQQNTKPTVTSQIPQVNNPPLENLKKDQSSIIDIEIQQSIVDLDLLIQSINEKNQKQKQLPQKKPEESLSINMQDIHLSQNLKIQPKIQTHPSPNPPLIQPKFDQKQLLEQKLSKISMIHHKPLQQQSVSMQQQEQFFDCQPQDSQEQKYFDLQQQRSNINNPSAFSKKKSDNLGSLMERLEQTGKKMPDKLASKLRPNSKDKNASAKKHSSRQKSPKQAQQRGIRSSILEGQNIMEETDHKNPFLPSNTQLNYKSGQSIKVLLIVFSEKEIELIHIIKPKQQGNTNNTNVSVVMNRSYNFMGIYYALATFELNKNKRYRMQIVFYNKKSHEQQFKIPYNYMGCNLSIINHSRNKNYYAAANHAIFEGINFLIKRAISHRRYIQEQILIWLKIFYQQYKRQIKDQQTIEIILYKVQTKDYNSINSKFFIYFLYSIYREKALDYYQKCRLASNMAFPTSCERYFHKSYPMTEQLNNFYLKLHLYDILLYPDDYGYQTPKNVMALNLKYQPVQQILQMITRVLNTSPQILSKIDNEVRQLFKSKQSLCAHDYYNIKIRYIKYSYQSSQLTIQQRMLLQFMNDLIGFYAQRCQQRCNKQAQVIYEDIENLFSEAKGFMGGGRVLRLGTEGSLPFLYSRCKILDHLSQHQFDFMQVINAFVKSKIQSLTRIHAIGTFLSAITIPVLPLDHQLVERICINVGLHTHQIKQIIRSIVEDKSSRYDSDAFENIILKYFTENEKVVIEPDIILQSIDQSLMKNIQDKNKADFLKTIFSMFAPKLRVIQQANKQKKINSIKFKKYLQAYFKIANQTFRHLYINKLFAQIKFKLKSNGQQFFNQLDQAFPHYFLENQPKRQHLINIYLESQQFNAGHMQQQIINFMKSNNSGYIQNLYRRNKETFMEALNNIILKINMDDIYNEQLQSFLAAIKEKGRKIPEELRKAIFLAGGRKEDFLINMRKIVAILQNNRQIFKEDIKNLKQYQNRVLKVRLVQAYKVDTKYEYIYENNSKIFAIQQYPFWNPQQITKLQDIVSCFKTIQTKVRGALIEFIDGKILYNIFKEFFTHGNFRDICTEYVKNEQINRKINHYKNKSNEGQIRQIVQYSESLTYMYSIIKSSDLNISFTRFNEFVQKIQNNDDMFLVEEFMFEMSEVQKKLITVYSLHQHGGIDNLSNYLQKEESAKIVSTTYRQRKMFQAINNKNLDSKSITDLKEYINDLQNSILKMQTIKQFQNVLLYWEIVKKAPNFSKFIQALNDFIHNRKVNLSNCITNCAASYKLLQQKLDEAVNRQTSFKYEIQAIFKESIFQITDNLQIQIAINTQNLDESTMRSTRIILNEETKQMTIDYKTMSNYKDKSILLINDIGRDQNLDQSMKDLMKLFERYNELFGVAEEIHLVVNQLSNYGYNPKEISQQLIIEKNDITKIIQKRNSLIQTSGIWLKGIKELYSKSYLLTHFIGSQLNKFIDNCIEKLYSPSLGRIIGMSVKQFNEQFSKPQNKIKVQRAKNEKRLQRVQCIIEIFENYQKNYMNSSRVIEIDHIEKFYNSRQSFFQNYAQKKVKPIILLTCTSKQIYSCLVEASRRQQKKIAKPTQVLYCQQSTSPQQIQFFLDRAMICQSKTHYIIGAHNLKEQTKLTFCDQLSVLLRERPDDLKSSQLCFIDDVINDKLYAFISRPKLFQIQKKELYLKEAQEGAKTLVKLIRKTIIVTSKKAGLGKTFHVEQQAEIQGKKLKYFPICGNVNFERLSKRLKKLSLTSQNSLLIQIGHIQNKKKLQVFLSQIIIFRCFYFQQYIFIPQNISIYIELQNIVQLQNQDSYHILNILKSHGKIHNIEKFDVDLIHIDLQNYEDKFVYVYLSHLNKPNWISNNIYSYQDYLKQKKAIPFPSNTRELLEKYFSLWFIERKIQPTYLIFKAFKNMLFNAFKSFSESPYLYITNFEGIDPAFKKLQLQKSRQNFLHVCISNALQFLKETVTTNDFDQDKNNLQSVSQIIRKFPMLIVSSYNFSNYQFIYLNDESVNIPIKSLLLSQNPKYFHRLQNMQNINQLHQIFKQSSLSNSAGELQELRMFKILLELSGNKKFDSTIEKLNQGKKVYEQSLDKIYKAVPSLNNYKLTLDNFFKMCLIIHRSSSYIPSIIMGQSGVGKTALIDFLVRVVFQQELQVYNVHAGIHQDDLQQWVNKIKKQAHQYLAIAQKEQKQSKDKEIKPKRLWVFFDQFNTTDELNYIKEMVIDRRFLGQTLPENIVFLAACNPYRKKQESVNRVRAGIKKTNENKGAELAFKVKPPSLSMIQLMWDYQQLGQKENQCYIQKMLSDVKYKKREVLIKSIVYTHQLFKKTVEVSSVSLRDVTRYKQLYNWFLVHEPKPACKKQNINPLQRKNEQNKIQPAERAAILAFCFCYALRYSTSSQRKAFLQNIQGRLNFQNQHMQKVLQKEQKEYINQLKVQGEKIAYNSALMENVFTSLVCLMNKIPILIIGNPGSSKSLSIKMLNSNLRGENSTAPFCKELPEINMIYYQGSQASTSKGVEQVFDKATSKNLNDQNKKWNILNCILFDQIGLAQKSIHNPLKVLHAKLQTNIKEIGFIGISNWQLDSAKMSRFLVISRSNPDENEIKDTSVKIYESYLKENTHLQRFRMLGSHYYKFINKWNNNLNNRQGFFGLRDFYSYIKYICAQIIQKGNNPHQIDKAVAMAIQINFDGQKESLKLFREIASTSAKNSNFFMNPIELVNKNLQDTQSRCLMLIIRGDSLIPIINDKIEVRGEIRKAICIYGSTFLQDQESEQYNLEVTSLIINHVSRGNILAFKDINNSIQTSLYDLFNKSFSQIGSKKYCRIAVGANSNPKCNVHNNFNAIVYVDQQKLRDLDLAFLNRFQKHYLNLKSMINPEQLQIVKQISRWIDELLSFKAQQETILKNQNFLINSSQQSIVTLLIKYRGDENRINRIKAELLRNRTTDLTIAIKGNQQKEEMVNALVEQITPVNQCKQDMIIFTYDQFSNLSEQKTIFKGKNHIIRLSQIKNQKGLRKQLLLGFSSQCDNIEIKVYYQNHYMHINFILFLAKQIKSTLQSNKQIIIIIQLHRFSLHQLNIQYINISYLHKFSQYFVQDIHSLEEIPHLLSSKNCWQAYQRLNLSVNFTNFYMDALKLVKFKCQFQEIQSLREMYFVQCLQIVANEYFKQNTQKMLQQYLKKKRTDFSLLQKNAQDIMCCSNIKQALAKYVGQMIKQIIFYSIRLVVEEGFLFYFIENRSIKTIHIEHADYLRQAYKKQEKKLIQFFHTHYQEQIAKLIPKLPRLRQQIKFQKAIESNIVRIKSEISLISSSFKDFGILFKDKQKKDSKNLQEIAQKIPIIKKQQNESQYQLQYINALNFIQTQFKISSHQILKQIAKSKDLEKLYLYDVLTYYLRQNNQDLKNICIYIEIMVTILEQFPLPDKLIFLTNDKRLMINILQLFSLLFEQQKPVNIIEDIAQIPKKNAGSPLIEILIKLFDIGIKAVNFNKDQIKNFKSVGQYITYFRSVFIKMRQIYISYNEYGLKITKQFISTNKMLEMFQKIQLKNDQLVGKYVNEVDEEHTIYYCINKFCRKLLQDQRITNSRQIIINFLSLDIFCNWQQKIDQQQQYEQQREGCIEQFVQLCNKYTLFANNSAYSISLILPGLTDVQSIQQLKEYLNLNQQYYVKEEYIDMESNFTVALSNYIASQIQEIFARKLKDSAEEHEQAFITKTFQNQFINLVNSIEDEFKIFKLFKIEFMKRYAFYYLSLLIKNLENELQIRIDILLCQDNQLMKHLRMYLLKHLYVNYESFQNIKRDFIEQNRCKWILKLRDLLDQNEEQFFVPPQIDKNNKMQALMKTLAQKKFQKVAFHDLVLEGLKNQKNRYQLLTYFMLTFYTKSIAQNFIYNLTQQIQTRHDLREQKNHLIKQLLVRYLKHKVTNNCQFINNEEFMRQIPLLNYLNIVVSTSNTHNPFNEMFFNQYGYVPLDYSKHLECRYLIGSLKNPALGRLQFILKRQSQNFNASSYINCSKKCDYISPVGGNFYGTYDGCANPYHQSKCAFCGNVIGAHAYNVLTNPQAKKFMPNTVQQMMPIIKQKTKVTLRKIDVNFEYSLLGYTLGNTKQKLKQSLELKRHYAGVATDFLQGQSEMIHHKLLQTIVNFVWSFLVDATFIKQNSLKALFNYDSQNSKIFLNQATNFYFEQTNRSVKFANKNDHIIWHLGIGKMLLNLLTQYNQNQQVKGKPFNLTNASVRDNFEKYVQDFLFPYCEKEKEKLILESRTVKTVNKTDVIREIGDLKQHLLQYPQLKLYKLLKIELSPSYENMKKEYKETLAKDYPILSYLMNNQTVEQKLKYFKTIYTFLSKLWKIFNLQITRQDSKKPLNQILISTFKDNQKQLKEIEGQMNQFVKSWNRLAQLKYELKHQCHQFGELQKIDKTYPLRTFLLDKDHMDNIDGRKLIGLIIVSVNEYNSICGIIQNSVKAAYSQQSARIFSSNLLNPTILTKDSKVLLFPTESLQDKIERYSSFSVQYGISNPSYPFDQIQSMVAKEFYGCKYLISEEDKFCYINYIGQQVHFITELRQDQNQKTLEQTNLKQRIKQYLKNAQKEQTFYKTIKGIQGSLENIVIFFKNFKGIPDIHTMTIRNFVNQKRIKGIVKEIFEEPIQSLPLSNLADFYETIEFLTFEKVRDMLDPVYKKQLQKPQKQQFLALVRSMKRENRQLGIPSYSDFKIAIYRLAGRNLLLMMCDEKRYISQQLCYVSFYWPKDVNIDYFQQEATKFTEVMGKITLSKVGDMLVSLPFKEKEADDEARARIPEIQAARRMERVLDLRPRQRNPRNRNILD